MNLNQLKECVPLMDSIEVYLDDLFSILFKQFASLIPNLKDDFKVLTDKIDTQFDWIKNEIDLRIESLKIQLDMLNEDLKNELDDENLFMKRCVLINFQSRT